MKFSKIAIETHIICYYKNKVRVNRYVLKKRDL